MTTTLIGYARCSTDKQDLAAQKAALERLGVAPERIYTDRGLTGTNRSRPGLDQALAAVRTGDTLVVPKLDRLARSVPDARTIADALVARGVKLALGASVYDPADPMQGSRIKPVYPYDTSLGGSEVSSFAQPSRVREPQSLRSQLQA
jgi:DNA invertase Pin-like site-specific DNA recombinase